MWIEVFLMIVFVKCCFGLDGMFRWFWKEGLGVVIKKYVKVFRGFFIIFGKYCERCKYWG